MNTRLKSFAYFALFTLTVALGTSVNAQTRAFYVTETQVRTVTTRIETRTDAFQRQFGRSLDRSGIDGTNREDSLNTLIENFEEATNRLRDDFTARRSTAANVEDVLAQAVFINSFMTRNRLTPAAQNSWAQIRADLNTLAGYYRVRSNWNGAPGIPVGQNPYYVTDTQVRTLLARIETRTNLFQRQIDRGLDRSNTDGTNREDSINNMIANFETATDALRNNFTSRRSTAADVEEVLNRAVGVNNFVRNNRLTPAAQASWTQIRTDLNTLAGYYRVTSNWNAPIMPGPGTQFGSFDSRITGTYRLNTALSDVVPTVVDRAILSANYNGNQRDRARRNLERRLAAPISLMLEKRGRQVTLASADAQQVVLDADGVSRTETSPNGRTVRTSVTATGNDLTINYEGDRMNDYYVSFMPMNDGQLKVTRRIYLENQNETVTAVSVYDKTSQMPQWNTSTFPVNTNDPVSGFMIPNGTGIVATLDTPLSTRTARDGDRFSMSVTSPSQYVGAIIEGSVIGERSGVISGRANMSLSFDTIRMGNGQPFRFAGIVDQVRGADGNVVNVSNEGTIRDDSQTNKTITRAGIGGALGAILGAVIGGGKGAIIGAGTGAGVGAGTVILQGRDNLELAAGSQFTITATAPSNTISR